MNIFTYFLSPYLCFSSVSLDKLSCQIDFPGVQLPSRKERIAPSSSWRLPCLSCSTAQAFEAARACPGHHANLHPPAPSSFLLPIGSAPHSLEPLLPLLASEPLPGLFPCGEGPVHISVHIPFAEPRVLPRPPPLVPRLPPGASFSSWFISLSG